MVGLTNLLDIIFPEFKSFFNNRFSATSIYLLDKYKNADKLANMRDFDTPYKISRGSFLMLSLLNLKNSLKILSEYQMIYLICKLLLLFNFVMRLIVK